MSFPHSACAALVAAVLSAPGCLAADLVGNARIIDGDTLEIDDQTVRLEGIDTPEMKQECQDASSKSFRCGRTARDALRKLTTGPVTCSPAGKDRYGRILVYCRSGDVDLNRQMVLDGWALVFIKYSVRYTGDEKVAAEAKRGTMGRQGGKGFRLVGGTSGSQRAVR